MYEVGGELGYSVEVMVVVVVVVGLWCNSISSTLPCATYMFTMFHMIIQVTDGRCYVTNKPYEYVIIILFIRTVTVLLKSHFLSRISCDV